MFIAATSQKEALSWLLAMGEVSSIHHNKNFVGAIMEPAIEAAPDEAM